MRRLIQFDCCGAALAGTLDEADGSTGLLIVSGGNEIRSGAHRGMAALASDIAGAGHPVMRFDRRGIGDSEGENRGFLHSRDDIVAAIAAFRAACPGMRRVVAFGNCDAASALALHQPLAVDALVIANPWTIEQVAGNEMSALPPAAAIKARYWARLRDPASLARLVRGEVDLSKLGKGIAKLLPRRRATTAGSLGSRVVDAIAAISHPITLLLATGDRTAQIFIDHWQATNAPNVTVSELDSTGHSFAGKDADWLRGMLMAVLSQRD